MTKLNLCCKYEIPDCYGKSVIKPMHVVLVVYYHKNQLSSCWKGEQNISGDIRGCVSTTNQCFEESKDLVLDMEET